MSASVQGCREGPGRPVSAGIHTITIWPQEHISHKDSVCSCALVHPKECMLFARAPAQTDSSTRVVEALEQWLLHATWRAA